MKSFYISILIILIISVNSFGQVQRRGLKGIEYLSSTGSVHRPNFMGNPGASIWGKMGVNIFNHMTIDAGLSLAFNEEHTIKMLVEPGVEYQIFQQSILAPKIAYHLVLPPFKEDGPINLGVGAVYLHYTDFEKGVNVIRPNASIAFLRWLGELNLGYNIRLSEKEEELKFNKFNIALIIRLPLYLGNVELE